MKIFLSFCLMLMLLLTGSMCSPRKDDDPVKKIDFYIVSGKKNTLSQLIQEEIGRQRKPILYFTADWCAPCRRFKGCLDDPKMREALHDATLIMIDVDTDSEEDTLSFTYDVHAVPTFIRVNADGSVIKQITSAAWDDDTPENIAPVITRFLE
ncbi:MAG: thioredoxin family protein [Bacteroidia bacterium]|nr:thioredoxin family protein [Bacteroidia bacterium]